MASAYMNILNSTRRPKDVNYFHISSVKRSPNSYWVCSASTPSIGQKPKDEKRCFTDCIYVLDPITNAEIQIFCGTTDKTCVLDPLPAIQLRDNITSIVSIITLITNASLDEAVMPSLAAHGTQSQFQDTGSYIQSHADEAPVYRGYI